MDCIISIKGNGVGNNGHPKHDRSGPVREFLVDNQVFYRVVKNHVFSCDKCDPSAILQVYLDRRLDIKFWQTKKKPNAIVPAFPVSVGLTQLALQYDKRYGKSLRPGLVRQFIKLSMSSDFLQFISYFNEEDILDRAQRYFRSQAESTTQSDWQIRSVHQALDKLLASDPLNPKYLFLIHLLKLESSVIESVSTVEEARRLVLTSEVMCS